MDRERAARIQEAKWLKGQLRNKVAIVKAYAGATGMTPKAAVAFVEKHGL
jgi:hypothetical protein